MLEFEEHLLGGGGGVGMRNRTAVQGNVTPVRGTDCVLWKHRQPPLGS